MNSISQFCNKYGITLDAEWTERNPNMADGKYPMTHWRVTLKRANPRRQMTVIFSMGMAHTGQPGVDDVMNCLLMDASGMEYAENFEDWANEYGYDPDSRTAEHIYESTRQQTAKLRQFLGDQYEEAYQLEPL